MSASERSFAKGRPWAWYLAAALAATGLYVLMPANSPASIAIFLATNTSVIGALAWGIRRYRPDPRAPWLVLLAGYALLLIANAARYGNDPLAPLDDDAVAGGLYLVAYLGIAIGLLLLVRARGAMRDVTSLADAAIVVTGIATLWFEFLIGPVLESPGITPSERFVTITFPVPDLVFLVLLLWLAFSKGPRGATLPLLIGGIVAQAVADALLGISDVGLVSTGGIERPLWLLSLALVGAAALHPSLPLIGARSDQPSWLPAGRRIYLLAVVSLLVPLTLLRHAIVGGSAGGLVLAVTMAMLILLIYARLRELLVDVDTYARVQAQLTAAEARFRRLVEQVPAVIYIDSTDEAAASRYVSPRWKELTGQSPEEAVAHPWLWSNQIHPDDREWVMAARQANARNESTALGYRIITRDGSELWVRDEATVTDRDAEGRARRWQGVLVDVTEAHRAEAEIRRLNAELEQRIGQRTAELKTTNEHLGEANTYLESLISGMPAMLFRGHGPDFGAEYISTGVERILGFTAVEVMATPGFWMERIYPDDRERVTAGVRDVIEHRLPLHTTEYRMVHRDGHERWVHAVVHYEFDVDGAWRFTGTAIDVTERRRVEDELRRAKEEAERANRAKSEFLSSMSHELRTPLNAVLGFGQLLERSALSHDDRDSVAQILRAGRTLLAMIDSVLELARVESGQLTLSIEPVSVEEVIAETTDLVRPLAAEREIRLELPARLDEAPYVLADRRRLKQVVLNLLSNAVKFNRDAGTVVVTVEQIHEPDRLRLAITDTGPGIPPERRATLFTRFDRTPAADRAATGLGVGLALSARLMAAMGGSISVESELGTGSTFAIELPRAAELPQVPGDRVPGSLGATPASTILYVEDNLANLTLIERILGARPGTRLLAAMQGRLGLELGRQHHPDLVLLDFHLPDVPGDEFLAQLREDPTLRDIPVIVLSSSNDSGIGKRMRSLGARAYLPKPIDVDVFLRTVDEALAAGGRRG